MGSYSSPPSSKALSAGDRLDRYELLCVLAQGGMGTVWLARMTGKLGFERLVALKTILAVYNDDRQFGDMFLDEARIAARIDHENVARILDIGEDHGLLYYAMELIDGESVRKLYRDVRQVHHPFPTGVALRIAADACAGLHATHEILGDDGARLEVVHRDVSPQNLLVSVRGTTKLIDFGVAKARARNTEETAAGTLKGKIEYMAPEQARGEPLDRRADVYSVGAVLYELLCGRPVRDTDEGRQLAALHELMTGAPYQALPFEIPAPIREVVDCALARDPSRRFPTAEALRRAIEHAMAVTGQSATHDDVARVLAHYSGERTAKRKDAIERAIAKAQEGRTNAATIVAPVSVRQLALAPQEVTRAMPPAMGAAQLSGPYPAALTNEPVTGPSMQGASFTSAPAAPPPRGSSVGKVFAALFVLGLVAVLGVVAGVIMTKRTQVAAAPPEPPKVEALPVATTAATPATPPIASAPEPPVTGSLPSSATSSVAARDAGAPSKGKGKAGTAGTSTSKAPVHIGGTKPTAGDGDEYGF